MKNNQELFTDYNVIKGFLNLTVTDKYFANFLLQNYSNPGIGKPEKGNKKIVVCRNLKEIEELLEEHSFARVHRCYLVNLNEVEKFVRGDGGYLIMSDSSTIDVSRNRKEELLKKLLTNRE